MLSPSPTGVSSDTGSSIRSNSSRTRSSGEAGVLGDLLDRRVAVELLRQLAARALRAAHLLGDVDGQPDRAALVGERAGDRLADPPRRVRRELEAELVVELLDRPDQAHVPLLDQVEERHAGLRVVARDRHHEAQVALDQAPLRGLVAEVLAAGELALLGRRQQPAVADLADVELERVGASGGARSRSGRRSRAPPRPRRRHVERGQELEDRLGGSGSVGDIGKRVLHIIGVSAAGSPTLRCKERRSSN